MKPNMIITGASNGIGLECANYFQDRYNIINISRTPCQLSYVNNYLGDLKDTKSISNLLDQILNKHNTIDVLINNAGIEGRIDSLENIESNIFNDVFNINVISPMEICKKIIPGMKKKRKGVILNIGSGMAYKGMKFWSIYAASKHALLGFTRCLSDELIDYNIKVRILSPGLVETNFRNEDNFSKITSYRRKELENMNKLSSYEVAEKVFEMIESNESYLEIKMNK